MNNELIINARPHETRVARLEDGVVVEVFNERKAGQELLGNIYCGKVTRVLPGMQAAFVDVGIERTAFLYVSDVHMPVPHIEQTTFEVPNMDEDPDGIDSELYETQQTKGSPLQIEALLREGQQITVQVCKEPMGEKGARLTSYLSIPGRYLVLMPTVDHIGVSRLIEDIEEKERLKKIIHEIRPANLGFIARTVSEDVSKETLQSEVEFLLDLWAGIKKKIAKQSNSGLIYKDLPISLRIIRDLFTKEIHRLVIDSNDEYLKIMEFINNFPPELKHSVEFYDGKNPIFDFFGIEKEISRALETKVLLSSGAHIIIERTEALTSIDVNTGSYVGKTDLEETILKTNLDAINEIARQLRLRNIGGIIVIDFISMEKKQNRENVCEALKDALKKDKAKTNVLPMSDLGLIEMTRKRTRPSLNGLLMEPCLYCRGSGRLKSKKEICRELFRSMERESPFLGENNEINASVNPLVGEVLKNEEMRSLAALEKRLRIKINITVKEDFHLEQYKIWS